MPASDQRPPHGPILSPMADHVTLVHPDGGDAIHVTPLRARILARQGWTPDTSDDAEALAAYEAAAHPTSHPGPSTPPSTGHAPPTTSSSED